MTTGKPFFSSQGSSSLQRPLYSPGLLLEDEDLNVGVAYTQGIMRLMLKSLFGCGVICGLEVTAVPTCHETKRKITVNPGIALDGEGNLIEVAKPWNHEFGPECDGDWPKNIWVVLCYREKCCRPKDVACSAEGDGESKQTRVRAGYEINLWERLPKCTCRCKTEAEEDERNDDGEEDCGCGGRKKVKAAARTGTEQQQQPEPEKEDPCPCYTDHVKGVCGCDCCRCVVLAKVVDPETIVRKDENGDDLNPPIVEVDSSMVRRVRPVLNGYLQCLIEETPKRQRQSPGDVLAAALKAEKAAAGDDTQQVSSARQKLQERADTKSAKKSDKG